MAVESCQRGWLRVVVGKDVRAEAVHQREEDDRLALWVELGRRCAALLTGSDLRGDELEELEVLLAEAIGDARVDQRSGQEGEANIPLEPARLVERQQLDEDGPDEGEGSLREGVRQGCDLPPDALRDALTDDIEREPQRLILGPKVVLDLALGGKGLRRSLRGGDDQ